MSIAEVRDLVKTYPAFTLKEVSFPVEAGRITGFIGRNGAGKTTTIKSMLNLVHPDGGTVSYFGMPLTGNETEIKNSTTPGTMRPMQNISACSSWMRRKPRWRSPRA